MRARLAAIAGAVSALTLLVGCPVSKDTGLIQCEELCVSTLVLDIADGREEFQLQIYGDGLTTINVFCPDGIAAGIDADAFVCAPGSLTLERQAIGFPDLLRVTLDDGDLQDVTPTYGEPFEVCESTCQDGEATVAVD
ncbi:MAG: hypothetical protein H6741_33270 [Alphaproteobacteria bacterium]|nr:hypothetical protein [Alphaproteobacteria bacterium]